MLSTKVGGALLVLAAAWACPAWAQKSGADNEGLEGPVGAVVGSPQTPARTTHPQRPTPLTAAPTTTVDGSGDFSPDEVLTSLGTRGYEKVRHFRREGEDYLADAVYLGEPVKLKVRADTGQVIEPSTLSQAQARRLLEEQGYRLTGPLQQSSDVYRAPAIKDGHKIEITVSSLTGVVAPVTEPAVPDPEASAVQGPSSRQSGRGSDAPALPQ